MGGIAEERLCEARSSLETRGDAHLRATDVPSDCDNTPIRESEKKTAPRTSVPLACKSAVILCHSTHSLLLATKLVSECHLSLCL